MPASYLPDLPDQDFLLPRPMREWLLACEMGLVKTGHQSQWTLLDKARLNAQTAVDKKALIIVAAG